MDNFNIASAVLLGLMGAGHCLAMCGGIISSLSITSVDGQSQKKWCYIVVYQIGRIGSYSAFGATAGWMGLQVNQLMPIPILKILSGLLLIAMALYVSRHWFGLNQLEKLGKILWKLISPLSKTLLPVTSTRKAFLLGSVWGWLPCGLVYTALGYAIALGDSFNSSLFMFFFGIGTLPATLLAASASLKLKSFLNNTLVRNSTALVFLLMGIFTLYQVVILVPMHH